MLIYGIEKGDMLECTIQPSGILLSFLSFLSFLSLGKPFIVFIGRKSFYPFIAPTGEGEEGAENKTFGVRPLGVQDIPWAALRRIVFNRLQEFRLRVGPSERGG